MFTKNYYDILYGSYICNSNSLITLKISDTTRIVPNVDMSGVINVSTGYNIRGYATMKNQHTYYSNNYVGGVVLGTGKTPPTIEDVKMENEITYDQVKLTQSSLNYIGNGLLGVYTVENLTDADITISEIGMYNVFTGVAKKEDGSLDTTAYVWRCLVERTLLEKPITVPAGGIENLVYKVQFEYPQV